MTTPHEAFSSWGILEIMGHRRLGGYITEQEIAGAGMLRIDIPIGDHEGLSEAERDWATQFYAPSALYALTPCSEQIAREIARNAPRPIEPWDLRQLLPKPAQRAEGPVVYYEDGVPEVGMDDDVEHPF